MGRMLGYHDSDELDRPELNKCPDCECFFASEACPLCGKICPEEMRAGHRAKVKPRKKGRSSSGRVQFIPWYHSWWFILIMMYFMPIAGIVLFFTSPHSKKAKIIAASIVVGIYVLLAALSFGAGFWGLLEDSPVNDDLSRNEYVERCEEMDVEQFYRNAYDTDRYVTMELTVVERLAEYGVDVYDRGTYYRCRDTGSGELMIFILDCNLEQKTNYLPGDRIRVYGESGGMISLEPGSELPCLYMAYCERIE